MSRLIIPAGAHAVFQWDSWTLYELPHGKASDSILWYHFKFMLPPGTRPRWRQRRAYILSWNPDEMRFKVSRETLALEIDHPDLYDRVELIMSLAYGPEWLRDVQGVTDAEIQAERVRLRTLAAERRAQRGQRVMSTS